MFEGDVTLRCDCWYPAEEEDDIRHTLVRMSSTNMVGIETMVVMMIVTHGTSGGSDAID